MKKVYFLLLASVSLLMASCDKSSDYVEPQPEKQEVQTTGETMPESVKALHETGVSIVPSPQFYAEVEYTYNTYEVNTIYFYKASDHTVPLITTQDIECKFKVLNYGIYHNTDVELMLTLPTRTVIIPKGVSSYVLFQKLFQNTMDGYVYHNYVLIESIKYI